MKEWNGTILGPPHVSWLFSFRHMVRSLGRGAWGMGPRRNTSQAYLQEVELVLEDAERTTGDAGDLRSPGLV